MKESTNALLYVFLGMIISAILAGVFSHAVDGIKGWMSYGWWFIATFFASLLGSIGLLLLGYSMRKKRD